MRERGEKSPVSQCDLCQKKGVNLIFDVTVIPISLLFF